MAQTYSLNQRLAGTTFLDVGGLTFLLGDDFEFQLSTPKRETKKGGSGVYGYTEMPNEGHMKGTAYDYAGNSVTNIGNLTDVTMTASLANGKVITLVSGWFVEPPVVKAGDGTYTFNVESGTVTEDLG